MELIRNRKMLESLLERHRITSFFRNSDLPFALYQFEKGEYLDSELDPSQHLIFPVSGTLRILHIRPDGTQDQIASGKQFTCLGDMEFASGKITPYLVEIMSPCMCIVLPLRGIRGRLENDPVFLRFLLGQLAEKIDVSTASKALPRSLTERLDFYIRTQCQDNTLKGVEKAASALACSKRQLLRILKQLCKEGKMVKTGHGSYKLLQELSISELF